MMSGQSGDEDGPQALLTGVYVCPDYRGRQCGVADALLDEVEDWACRTSDLLRLYVYENSPRAIGFYRRRDFRETGRRRQSRWSRADNPLEMVKALRPGPESLAIQRR
jgi:ribosomal protein S18 acetylase RimI-like enzyme